jgi:diguanylate cyclase (GGDEF)-like protein
VYIEEAGRVSACDATHATYLLASGKWGVRFGTLLEQRFRQQHLPDVTLRNRFFTVCAVLFVSGLAWFDLSPVSDVHNLAQGIRFGLIVPLLLITLGFSFKRQLRRYEHVLTSLSHFLIALSVMALMTLSQQELSLHYHGLLILTVVYGNLLLRHPFWYALSWSLPALACYYLLFGICHFENVSVLRYYAVLFSAMTLASLVVNYQLDHRARLDFLKGIITDAEKEQWEHARRDLYRLALVDSLTGLYNRRHFDEVLATAWRTHFETGAAISLLFIDVDDFKPFNDTYGHQRGDRCLRLVAENLLALNRRPSDVIARYGGEEFVIILLGMSAEGARQMADNVRMSIENLRIPHLASSVSDVVTVSVGVSTAMPSQHGTPRQLLERADQALYLAKEQGRNRVKFLACRVRDLVAVQ